MPEKSHHPDETECITYLHFLVPVGFLWLVLKARNYIHKVRLLDENANRLIISLFLRDKEFVVLVQER